MAIHVRFAGEIALLSGIGSLMNDPKHFDAGKDIQDLIQQGYLKFVMEMSGIRETGPTVLGLMTTLTRKIRQQHGEIVLANVGKTMGRFLEEMRMEDYWELFEETDLAISFLNKRRVGTPTVYE